MEILDILKVSSKSSPKSVAGAITAITREKRPVELQAVGEVRLIKPQRLSLLQEVTLHFSVSTLFVFLHSTMS